MSGDPELMAMETCGEALDTLEGEPRGRVLRYLVDRFGGNAAFQSGPLGPKPPAPPVEQLSFADAATLFDAASPASEPEKALVIGYWVQEFEGQQDWDSQSVNSILKNLGHGIGNITMALSSLRDRKPALVMQVQKTGSSKQARKRYKLTAAGVGHVRQMLTQTVAPTQDETAL